MKVNDCIFCGEKTFNLRPIYSDDFKEQIGTVRICSGCGRQFARYAFKKQAETKHKPKPKKQPPRPKKEPQQPIKELPQREIKKVRCTIGKDCAESASCEIRGDAMRCAVYRAVAVRKMRVLE